MIDWARLPLLLLTAILLLWGGIQYAADEADGAPLLAAGLVSLGVWLGAEAVTWHHRMHDKDDR